MHKIKYLVRRLINIIPGKIRGSLLYTFSASDNYGHLDRAKKKIIVTLAADYGNLGDVAITLAQRKFLEDNFKSYEIVSLPLSRTYRDLKSLKRKISSSDIITMVGGGNMGTLYESIENQRQLIVKKFPNNKIVSFPQSVYYKKDKDGRRHLTKAVSIYGKHPDFTLFARDEASYKFMKANFTKNKIDSAADIVLYMKEADASVSRHKNQIALSLRQDKESGINRDQRQALIDDLTDSQLKIIYKDTSLGDIRLNLEDATRELEAIWATFRASNLVITDRLHGMIFCVITRTPCIAINNNNGKVTGAYEKWLKDFNYISIINDFDLVRIKHERERLITSRINNVQKNIDFTKIRDAINITNP